MSISRCYIISEESHGPIGCAKSAMAAAKWLIATGWVNEYTEYGIFNEWLRSWEHTTIHDYCNQKGVADWEQWFIDNATAEWLEEHFLIYLRLVDLATDD